MTETFETALAARVAAMTDACTRCGKCVEACPVIGPGGVKGEPRAVISGVIDILRTGDGPQASRNWANACAAMQLSITKAFSATSGVCCTSSWNSSMGSPWLPCSLGAA